MASLPNRKRKGDKPWEACSMEMYTKTRYRNSSGHKRLECCLIDMIKVHKVLQNLSHIAFPAAW